MFRTHDCNSLRKSDIGRQVTLAGWVNVTRDHGGVVFIDLRDREGLTQIVFRPEENAELAKEAHSLRSEDVIEVSGRVAARLPGTENPNLATGDMEVIPNQLRILNRADALPPAPKQYKQLAMVAGVEKCSQIAKGFREEDWRADRQPQSTQIDIETSFVTPHRIFAVTEGMLAAIFKAARNIDIKTPFDRLTYREAVSRYGSDKPDRRFGMELVDLGEVFSQSSFKVFRSALDAGGVVKAVNAKGFAGITIGQADELTEIAKLYGAKGLAFIKIENGEWKSPIVKFFSEAEKAALQSKLEI